MNRGDLHSPDFAGDFGWFRWPGYTADPSLTSDVLVKHKHAPMTDFFVPIQSSLHMFLMIPHRL